jgi:Protein of unknown function (DUF4007)
MSLEQFALPAFATHQTFHPRFGWIKKGYDNAVEDPDVFNQPDAPVMLGVGKNMVEAIKAWATATHVIARVPNPVRARMSVALPTPLGRAMLDEKTGLDPYMEDPATLWVLHWQAVSAITSLPVWWAVFNDFPAVEFTDADLLRFCVEEVAATGWPQPNQSSIQKDVDCLLRMYTKRSARARQTLDELLDSPFREIGLIQPAPAGRNTYRFVRGEKPGLSAAVITYACLDYLATTDPDSRTATLTRLSADPGSPGRLMKLTQETIQYALEEIARKDIDIRLAAPAGITQLALHTHPARAAKTVLFLHYSERRPDLQPPGTDVAGLPARAADPLSQQELTCRLEDLRKETSRRRATR